MVPRRQFALYLRVLFFGWGARGSVFLITQLTDKPKTVDGFRMWPFQERMAAPERS